MSVPPKPSLRNNIEETSSFPVTGMSSWISDQNLSNPSGYDVGTQNSPGGVIKKVSEVYDDTKSKIDEFMKNNNLNPEVNYGSAKPKSTILKYPIHEDIPIKCLLEFKKYDRFVNSSREKVEKTVDIYLPLPQSIPDNYSLNVNTADLELWGNITAEKFASAQNLMTGEQSISDALAIGSAPTANQIQTSGGKTAATIATAFIASKISSEAGQNTAKSFIGMTMNPHTTSLFDGVSIRSFSLDWRFSPRSQQESELLLEIMNTIKIRAHPAEMSGGLSLHYPDICKVSFHGSVSKYFPKYQDSFITNISFNADSNAGVMLYNSGAPVTYTCQISFTELNILTRDVLERQISGKEL